MPKLTKTYVDNLKPADKDLWVWDAELQGFGVRVTPSGRKTYVVRYRTLDGTQRKHTVARCSDMPPEKGRELARKAFAQVAEGKDPAQAKVEAREAPTMLMLKDRYMAEHAIPFKKPNSANQDEQNWRLHILPIIGASKRVRAVTKADVLGLLGKLADKKATANQCVALLSKAFNLAEDWGLRDVGSNPCRRVKKHAVHAKELILSPAQIAALHTTLTTMVADGRVRPEFAGFIRALMVTACRKSEIMLSRRDWIDYERGVLVLPDSKVGKREVALSPVAIEILTAGSDGVWLVPGRVNGQPLKNPYKVWAAIKAEAKLPSDLRLHDLRHTAGSLAHMAGATQLEVAKLLGHKQMSTSERYMHSYESDAARVAGMVGDVFTKFWGAATEQQPA